MGGRTPAYVAGMVSQDLRIVMSLVGVRVCTSVRLYQELLTAEKKR